MLEFYHNIEIPESVNPIQITLVSDVPKSVHVYSYPEGLFDVVLDVLDGHTSFYMTHQGAGGWVMYAETDTETARMNLVIIKET